MTSSADATTSNAARPSSSYQYQSTKGGDVVVVKPSFDSDEVDNRSSQMANKEIQAGAGRDSPPQGHRRNLSEHFQNATNLASMPEHSATGDHPQEYHPRDAVSQDASPVVGQKHRRVFSGDVSNPPEAHRRINSIGQSSSVHRRPLQKNRQHQRVDSAGLDILTAAVDASEEELAAAVGDRAPRQQATYSLPHGSSRRTSMEVVSYDHSSSAPHAHPPPQASMDPQRGHPRSYYPVPVSSGYHVSQRYAHGPYSPPPYYRQTPVPLYHGPSHPTTHPSYPAQYARHVPPPPPGVKDSHGASIIPGPPETLHHEYPTQRATARRTSHGETEGRASSKDASINPPPQQWRGASTQGVQTYVTAISVGDTEKTLHSNTSKPPSSGQEAPPSDYYHHRKGSSLSSWAPPMSIFNSISSEGGEHPLKGHHRSTSSSLSFLGLDVGGLDNNDATFLKNLQASSANDVPAYVASKSPMVDRNVSPSAKIGDESAKSKLAQGGTSKRVRRKCVIEGCQNRVVQGGLCISHGAKRKQCTYPGCNKNVKKAGLCSTHGPSRKRCEAEGCSKVAVQGGHCIAHGAKKKLCAIGGCTKQAILRGMCKKHHDQNQAKSPTEMCQPCDSDQSDSSRRRSSPTSHKPTHTRGLSLFQEISAEAVGDLLEDNETPTASGIRHRSGLSNEFGSMY